MQIRIVLLQVIKLTKLPLKPVNLFPELVFNDAAPLDFRLQVSNSLCFFEQSLHFVLQLLVLEIPLRAVVLVHMQLLVDVFDGGFPQELVL